MKKIIAAVLICIMTLIMSVSAFADGSGVIEGEAGDKVSWEVKDGVLTLSGKGRVSAQSEWDFIKGEVEKAVIGEDISLIEGDCFEGFENLKEAEFKGTPIILGAPFKGCKNIKVFGIDTWMHFTVDDDVELDAVYYNGTTAQWNEAVNNIIYGDMLPLYKAEIHCSDGIIEKRDIPSGEKGGVRWSFENGEFTLSGSGKFNLYDIYNFNSLMTRFVAEGDIELSGSLAMNDALKEAILPDCMTEMDKQFFSRCTSLEKVKLPEKLETLNLTMFGDTPLKNVTIPSGTKTVVTAGFNGLLSLENVYVEDGNESFVSKDGVLFDKDMSVLILYPEAKENRTYTVPEGVKSIAAGAFRRCRSLEEAVFPKSLEEIGDYAFENSKKLKKVSFNSGVKIGGGAFIFLDSLKEIDLKEGTTLSENSFAGCGFEKVELPKDLKEIPSYCFGDCEALKSISLDNIKILGKSAFFGCTSLEKVRLMSLEGWEGMPKDGADEETGKVEIDGNLNSLSDNAPFFGCEALREVYISFKGAPEEADAMFIQCPSLESVVMENLNFELCKWEFYMTEGERAYMQYEEYAGGMKHDYIVKGGRTITKRLENLILYGDEKVCEYAKKTGAEYGYLANEAGYEAFRGNKDIKHLYVGNSVKEVEICAFADTNIESVIISQGVERLNKWAFASSKNLERIVIEEGGDPKIDGSAFYDISPNADIYIPSTQASLPDTIFYDWAVDENGNEKWFNPKFGDIRLYVPSGSYAERFAREKGLKHSIVIDIYIDGRALYEGSAILENGRTLVPLRALGEAVGAEASWDDERKTAIVNKDGVNAEFPVGEKVMYIKGEEIAIDTAAIIEHGRTMIPLRAAAEAFGADVEWDDDTKSVLITLN